MVGASPRRGMRGDCTGWRRYAATRIHRERKKSAQIKENPDPGAGPSGVASPNGLRLRFEPAGTGNHITGTREQDLATHRTRQGRSWLLMTGKIAVGGITRTDALVLIRVIAAGTGWRLASHSLDLLGREGINIVCCASFADHRERLNLALAISHRDLDQS